MSNHTEDSTENLRCFKEKAPDGPSLFQGGKLVLQNYHIGWIITGVFTLIACVVSLWLVGKHLRNYTNKHEQRYIVRILFMVPIYALVSFASFLFWNHATLLILVRDCYESTVLTAFFYLLLLYLSPTSEGQRKIFLKSGLSKEADREALRKGETPQKWMFPLGSVKWKPKDGLYFLQLMKWGVLQYCVIRPTTTLAAVILEYLGLYCEESWGLGWGHPYIVIIVSISVSIAMYCLIQLYLPVSVYLAPHRPLLKLFAIKAVVFLTFWQATFLSALSLFGVVKATKYMTAADVNIGIGAILETVEMTIFAFLHIRAFSYKPYVLKSSEIYLTPEHTPLFRSLGHAFDFRETFKEIWHGMRYMGYKFKKQEVPEDIRPRRAQAYGVIFGKERDPSMMPMLPSEKQTEKSGESIDPADEKALPTLPVIDELDHDVDAYDPHERVRDWLGVGKAKHTRRETSDFGVQVERELQRRGLSNNPRSAMPMPDTSQVLHEATPALHMKHPTWWRRIYSRFSEHNQDPGTRFTGQDGRQGIGEGHYSQVNLDDLPPPSQLLSRRDSRYPSTLRPPVSGLPSPTDDRREDWLYSSFPAPPNIGAGRTGGDTVVDHPAILERPEASRHGQRGGNPERETRGLYRQKRTEKAARVHRRESALYHDS